MQDNPKKTLDLDSKPGASDESLDGSSESELSSSNDPGASAPAPQTKLGFLKRLRTMSNIYFVGFILLLILVLAVIYVTYRSNKSSNKTNNVSSLTDQQLSALKGNTTLVGDAKQTLDVQSNSIFEGQVLVRSDLNVAG